MLSPATEHVLRSAALVVKHRVRQLTERQALLDYEICAADDGLYVWFQDQLGLAAYGFMLCATRDGMWAFVAADGNTILAKGRSPWALAMHLDISTVVACLVFATPPVFLLPQRDTAKIHLFPATRITA